MPRQAYIGPLRLAFFEVDEFVSVSASNGTAEVRALLSFWGVDLESHFSMRRSYDTINQSMRRSVFYFF